MNSVFESFPRERLMPLGGGPSSVIRPAATGDPRVRSRAAQVEDAGLIDARIVPATRTEGTPPGFDDQVRMCILRRGAMTVTGRSPAGEHTAAAGEFLLRYDARPPRYQMAPRTALKMIILPAGPLRPLLKSAVAGPADAAEVRLLAAHANMIHATAPGLGPAGARGARGTLIELARAVATGRFDDTEPQLAPALVQAARDLADSALADPGLSTEMLARELHVSARTLQRAFAEEGETAAAYIRRRHLEEARLALTAWPARLTVAELAAYWQFADSSHFIRSFKKRYGQTPAEYASLNKARNY